VGSRNGSGRSRVRPRRTSTRSTAVTKGYEGRRPRTWAAITPTGRQAVSIAMKVLAALLHRFNDNRPDEPARR